MSDNSRAQPKTGSDAAPDLPAAIRHSWDANAAGWTRAVRGDLLASRKMVTNAAMLRALMQLRPRRVLDVGCGEGWLARELAEREVEVVGIDASPELVEAARAAGGGEFRVCSYEEIVAEPGRAGTGYDIAAFNFSLLEQRVAPVLTAVVTLLRPGGAVIIQTVHPWTARGDDGYRDGWRTETFAGLAGEADLPAPMPWYFRTLGSWISELEAAGLRASRVDEPDHPATGDPLSLLLTARPFPT